MSNDSLLKTGIIALTLLADVVLIGALGLEFPRADLIKPLGFAALLGLVGWFYQRRQVPQFSMAAYGLLHITMYTSCYSVLMYAGAALRTPLIDDRLMAFDHACGISLPSIVQWAATHYFLAAALFVAYSSLLWQTPLVIVVLSFCGDRKALEQFVLRFMIGTWLAVLIFCMVPAEGPFAAYGYEASPSQMRYLEHFHAMRSGQRTLVTWRNAEGLITFPSFHTTWALLLMLSVRHRRWLYGAAAILNGAVIVATLTTGWHYFADVAGGFGIAVVAVAVSTALEPWLAKTRDASSCAGPRTTSLALEGADLLVSPALSEKPNC
jgi:membrane-associated phospholipid phosphatase